MLENKEWKLPSSRKINRTLTLFYKQGKIMSVLKKVDYAKYEF